MPPIPIPLVGHLSECVSRLKSYINDDFTDKAIEEKQKMSLEVRQICASSAAIIAPMPLPFADIYAITSVQILMVRAIGNIYGYKLDIKAAKEVFAVIGGGIIGQHVCLQLFKWGLPGAGGLGGAAFVYAWSCGMAVTAQHYFETNGKASKLELKQVRERGMTEAESHAKKMKQQVENTVKSTEYSTAETPVEKTVSRLKELRILFDQGLIDDEEYKEQKARVLSEI